MPNVVFSSQPTISNGLHAQGRVVAKPPIEDDWRGAAVTRKRRALDGRVEQSFSQPSF